MSFTYHLVLMLDNRFKFVATVLKKKVYLQSRDGKASLEVTT